MSGKKPSGFQNRKRKIEEVKEAKKSSILMDSFLKKARDKNHSETEQTVDGTAGRAGLDKTHARQSTIEPDEKDTLSNEEQHLKTVPDIIGGNKDVRTQDQAIDNSSYVSNVLKFNDVGYLEFDQNSQVVIISQRLRDEMISRKSFMFQNIDGPFVIQNGRTMTKSWFRRRLANGDEVNRSWLVYSPVNKAAYCFCCLLFTSSKPANIRSSFESVAGFSNWKKSEKLAAHENSPHHRKSFTAWKEAERRISGKGIDVELQAQISCEKERWRDVLKRILSCIKYLANQNLALRGHEERLTAEPGVNIGNFLSLLQLIAEYDPLLAGHLQHAKENPRSVSYTSPEIQNELIHILAVTVRKQLISNIKKSKYYGILLDSTPDIAHREQLSVVIRYVDIDFVNKKVAIKESFLGFLELHAKSAASIEKVILDQLESDGLPLENCRSQCYDNAAVMSGHVSGVQKRIYDKNHLALFVNCDNHSLNLAGVHSAKQDPVIVTFFGTIESIYRFFSRSTRRWSELKNAVSKTVKRESETRWSARADAVNAIRAGLDGLLGLLEKLGDDPNASSDTRGEAETLLKNILNFNFLVFIHFWDDLLRKINRIQKRLQDPTIDFKTASNDLEALVIEMNETRQDACESAIQSAKSRCQEWGISIERRIRRRRQMPGESSEDAGLCVEDEIMRVLKGVFDRLQTEITTRFTRLQTIDSKFGFLLDIKYLLKDNTDDNLSRNCTNLGQFYQTDVDGTELYNEIIDCRMLVHTRNEDSPKSPLDLLHFIISYGDDVFPNLRIALQILLTISTSIASCERSFSKLKLILSYLRASMGQERFCDLALLSVEKEEAEKMNFDEVIDQFASIKARRIPL